MKTKTLLLLSFTSLCLTSCYYDNFKELHPENAVPIATSNCDTLGAISYSAQIAPMLVDVGCLNCHKASGSAHNMSTWSTVNADAVSGKLVGSVVWNGTAQNMPQGASSKISDCNIAKIKKWVVAGALNN